MKKLFLSVALIVCIAFTGCLDTVEELTINSNGAGTYKTTMDMSGLFDMLQMVAAMDTSSDQKLKSFTEKDFDSTIRLGSFADTAADLSAEQKKLFKDAEVRITIKQSERKFALSMNFPFTKPEQVEELMKLSGGGKALGMLGKKMTGENITENESTDALPSPTAVFDMQFASGLLERKLNDTKLAALKNNDQFKKMAEAKDAMGSMSFKTVIHLPSPVKKLTGEKALLSADKKTVTISSTLINVFENPAALAYRIEY
ncbi:MAG: hypothetical protein V4676_05865 [Bacteroidota bacterium]